MTAMDGMAGRIRTDQRRLESLAGLEAAVQPAPERLIGRDPDVAIRHVEQVLHCLRWLKEQPAR